MDATEKRSKELSRAIVALSNGIKAKEKKKTDFLKIQGLNIPKKPYKPDVQKNKDYLNKITGLPIPKKIPVKSKELTFLGNLTGVNHQQLSQQAIVDALVSKTQEQIESIKSEFVAKLEDITLQARVAELVRQNTPKEDVEVTDEMVLEILKRIKKLPNDSKLDVTDIKNYQSFIFNGNRYRIDELLHGGGSGGHGLDIQVNNADKGILEELNFLQGTNITLTYLTIAGVPTIRFDVTGGTTTASLAVTDLSSQANGTNKVFNLPPNNGVLELIGSDAPFIYRQGIDYTVSGTILTFDASVNVPSSGSTLLAEYFPGTPQAAFYDLSPFTDGLTSVFAIPASSGTLSLRGSDFPFIYEENVDFTVVGNILNLFTMNPPSAGSTLIFDYDTTTPTAFTVDLTPQANGVNTVFNIPSIQNAIALTGTDTPIVYRQGIDYFVSGTILVLTATVHPPAGTLLFTYV